MRTGRIVAFEPIGTSFLHDGRLQFNWGSSGTPVLKSVIDKHDPVGDETIISNLYFIADEGMRLNSGTVTDHRTTLYFNECVYQAILP